MRLLARTVNRIGVETLWERDGRYFARLENRTYRSEHEIPLESAIRRYHSMKGTPWASAGGSTS